MTNSTIQFPVLMGGIALVLAVNTVAYAQSPDQDRSQTQERSQMVETNSSSGVGEQNQDRSQEQVQTREIDGTGDPADRTQEQERTQDQVQAQDNTGTGGSGERQPEQVQTRTQAQQQVQTPNQLREFVAEQTQMRTQAQESSAATNGNATPARVRAEIMTQAVFAAETMLGQNGQQMMQIAAQLNEATVGMEQRVETMQQRTWLREFLFGQDREVAAAVVETAENNRERIQNMQQLVRNCDECDAEVVDILQEQLQLTEQEQARLVEKAEEQGAKRGVFGFLFGWMR